MGRYDASMDRTDWWHALPDDALASLQSVWIPVGSPGWAGPEKARWRRLLDQRFTAEGWRFAHVVRGAIVPTSVAIRDYEQSYRRYLRDRPDLVEFLVTTCGNVYDWAVENVRDVDYDQPDTEMNHYQDISVRRVIAELVDDPSWPAVTETPRETVPMTDLGTGVTHEVPRARGFRGDRLLQMRDPLSPGYMLNPAVVPVHDPALITTIPGRVDWYHAEGCGHLSVEAFWQTSKVVEVRLDRFLELGEARTEPLAGL
jgi:hypothetical protein